MRCLIELSFVEDDWSSIVHVYMQLILKQATLRIRRTKMAYRLP